MTQPLLHRLALRRVALAQIVGIGFGVALFAYLLTVSVGPYFQTGPKPGAPEAAFRAELGRSVPRILHHFHVPGVVISTVIAGTPAQTYAYGYADVARKRPMTDDTVFRVASISKSLTAWGVLRLVQSGKVDLDQPASRYLNSWPLAPSRFAISQVTVRRLLTHSAGVSAGEDTFHVPGQPAPSARQVLASQGDGPKPGPATLVAPAGQGFLYSVPGYLLLQMIVEQQSGQPFSEYMHRQVLAPLGMNSSSYLWEPALQGRMARPYQGDGQALPMQVPDDQAADSLFATASDLARFVAAPLPDKHLPAGAGVLDPNMVQRTYLDHGQPPTGLKLSSAGPETPGLGYFVEEAPGQPIMLTNVGLDAGWSSQFIMSPETGDGIVILTNSDAGAPAIAQITSIWTSWRGLPASNLNSGYRWFGVSAAVFLSLLAALDVAYAGGLALEIRSGGRRIGFSGRSPFTGNLLDLFVAATVLALWAGVFAAVRSMPTMHFVGVSVIGTLVALALARTLFPLNAPATRATGTETAVAA